MPGRQAYNSAEPVGACLHRLTPQLTVADRSIGHGCSTGFELRYGRGHECVIHGEFTVHALQTTYGNRLLKSSLFCLARLLQCGTHGCGSSAPGAYRAVRSDVLGQRLPRRIYGALQSVKDSRTSMPATLAMVGVTS